mmetsp:Transcript_13701/g.20799  ORF Transcript_13701/g.20799 Transcript_13701/m.20799 type:complete len:176 (+) Transcript_13701:1635-2162(+)
MLSVTPGGHAKLCQQFFVLLNEKIVSGAISTLISVPSSIYNHYSGIESISGLCLAVCLVNLEEAEKKTEYKKETFELVNHLLQSSNCFDIITCLNYQDISQSNVQILYGWMVDIGADAVYFETVMEALELSSFSTDIPLLQKFRSRAEKRRRDEVAFRGDQHATEQEEDDDEDEL